MFIALYKSKGFISAAIRWQTRGQYSHAAIVLTNGEVIEAREFKGVQILDKLPEPKKGESIDVFEIDSDLPNIGEANAWLINQLGKKYDYSSVLRFVSRRQESRTGSGKWFCSELVFAWARKAGARLLERVEPWAVSPNTLSLSPQLKLKRSMIR